MKFVKYLAFSIASIAAVLGMIYLERETSVVRTVKVTLGLDVEPFNPDAEGKIGMLETAQMFFNGTGDMPSLLAMMSTRSAPKAEKYLPKADGGWMREDRRVSLSVIEEFEYSFYPEHVKTKSELDVALEEATGMDATQVASLQMGAGGLKTVGAFYYREDMRMLVTINSLPKSMGWVMGNMMTMANIEATMNTDDRVQVEMIDWYGEKLAVRRDQKTGYAAVSVMAGEAYLVQIRGNVPVSVMTEFLQAIPLIVPVEHQQVEQAEPT